MSESTLMERLRSSELLSPEQLNELAVLPEAADPDPKVLGKVVFQRGWLTRFQISQAALGKGKDLVIGPYLLLDRIGEGGMGQVFKARHRHMKRVVALKLMRKEKLGSDAAVQRFYQEVEAAAQLTHPNIVLAFDAGQAGNLHFFSMEYVEGTDLNHLVREKGPLPVAQACDFIRQAALGLQHAHEQGMVHRDIKPSNLLLAAGDKPVVKILDMGLARLGDTFAKERNLTRVGQVLGTPDYLAPEQAIDARNVDIRADIYSLGCSLFFLLTRRAPFQAESLAELLMKHQMQEPASLRSLRPDAPQALEDLLRRLLAKKPEQRPGTPEEVAAALEPFARGEKGVAAQASMAVAVPQPFPTVGGNTFAGLTDDGEGLIARSTRRKLDRTSDTMDERPMKRKQEERKTSMALVLLIAGGGAGVMLLGFIVGLVMLFMLSPEASEGVAQPNPSAFKETVSLPVPKDGRLPLPPGDNAKATTKELVVPPPLAAPPPPAPEVAVLPDPGIGMVAGEVKAFQLACSQLRFAKDGNHAFLRGQNAVFLYDLERNAKVRTYPCSAKYLPCFAVSPDGKTIAIADPDVVRLLDVESGNEKQTFPTDAADLAFSPDGKQLAVSTSGMIRKGGRIVRDARGRMISGDHDVQLWALETGKLAHRFGGDAWSVGHLVFSSDGKLLMAGHHVRPLVVWDLQTHKERREFRFPHKNFYRLAPVKATHLLLGGWGKGDIRLWDLSTAREIKTFTGHSGPIHAVAVLQSGKQFVTVAGVDEIKFPDRTLPARDRTLRLWDIDKGVEVGRATLPWSPRGLALSPDGTHALVSDTGGSVRLIDLRKLGAPAGKPE